MVFGNLSTGYWLGAAAGAGLHWIELGRTTLTGTSHYIDVNGHGWVFGSGDSASNNVLTFTNGFPTSTNGANFYRTGYKAIGSTLSTNWVLRFRFKPTELNSNSGNRDGDGMGVFVMDRAYKDNVNDSAVETTKAIGYAFRSRDSNSTWKYSGYQGTSSSSDSGVLHHTAGHTEFTDQATEDEEYYIEIIKNGTTVTVTQRTGSHTGTLVETETLTSSLSGFTHINAVAFDGNGGTQPNIQVEVRDIELYDDKTSATGTPDVNITWSGLTAKPYMMVLAHNIVTSDHNMTWSTGTGSYLSSGNNYADRRSENGGADQTTTNRSSNGIISDAHTKNMFTVGNLLNTDGEEKLVSWSVVGHNDDGAGNAPDRFETVGKFTGTSQINQIKLNNSSSINNEIGSEVVVLGYDPDDTEGTSVWEELASVDLSGGTGDSLSSGTISAKKYLWVQAYLEQSGSGDTGNICRLNSDSGSNYAIRYSENGGSDATSTSRTNIVTGANSGTDGAGEAFYINMFIINKSDKEKLIIGELNDTDAGSGAGTAPGRSEFVAKWANTSGQITNITWTNSGGSATWATTSRLKVWGFD